MKLSPHFSLEEFTFSQTAERLLWNNTPDAEVIANLKRVAHALEEVRTIINRPIVITSGYRSPKLNERIGGAKNSAHMRGLAADIIALSFGSPRDLAEMIVISRIEFDKVILEFGRWVHFQVPPLGTNARKSILTARHAQEGTEYVAGLV